MALASKKTPRKFIKGRSGGLFNSDRITRASSSVANDDMVNDINMLEGPISPVLYHADLMQEDIDELRRYVTEDISSGGGGASSVNDLTDVTITSVVDGDLLRYNGTAAKWQNTNLGLTVTPTLSFNSTQYGSGQITITNIASYDDPAVFCQIKSGSTVIVPNSSMSFDDSTGIVSYIDTNSSGTRNIELRVQDFGDLQSELATGSYTKAETNFRYWRLIYNAESSRSHTYLKDLRYYTDVNQSGTAYPSNMTANNAPTPYVANASFRYNTTYDYWKAFDNNVSTGWWTIGSNTAGQYIDIDLGSSRSINSVYMRFNQSYYVVTNLSVLGSNSSNFSSYVALIDSASVAITDGAILQIEIN